MCDSKTCLLPRHSSIANICLILQRLERPIRELRRDDDRATTRPAGGDLYRLPLSSRDVVALLVAELGKGHRDQTRVLLLVQVGRHYFGR